MGSLRGISIEDVSKAVETIKGTAKRTPITRSHWSPVGTELFIKFENTQATGSFKVRGAYNKLNSLSLEEKKRGVIAASAGNHSQGVAFSAQKLGVSCTIVMPETAPLVKIEGTKSYGANIILKGDYYDMAYDHARKIADEKKLIFIHPYEDDVVIAGQGTIGIEINDELPNLDFVVVPIGGGGLISGVAMVIKHFNPKCKVYGVVSNQAPGMMNLKMRTQAPEFSKISTIADGIAVKKTSKNMFDTYIDKYVDEIVSVNDDEISRSIVHLMEKEKTVTEGSGAAGFAALRSGKINPHGKGCVILCGGNIDINTISRVIDRGLREAGRWTRVSVLVDDLPGSLAKLTSIIAEQKANVLDVIHDRVAKELSVRQTRIDFLIETASSKEAQKVVEALKQNNFRVIEDKEK